MVIAIFDFSSLPGQCQDQLLLVRVKRGLAFITILLVHAFLLCDQFLFRCFTRVGEIFNRLRSRVFLQLHLSADPILLTTLAVDV